MPTKFQLITELYDQTVQSVTGSYQSWTGFLRAACYNYKCPFDDQILIYAQRPDATAVLEMERWNRQFGRWVNRGAKSIAVFGDDGQNCLKLYFDVSDTHASRFARPLPIWTMHPAFEPEVIETLEATFGNLSEKENLADAVRSACHNAVADNFTDYLQDLRDCREDSLLEELDDLNLEVFYRDALEVSVAYMLMTRLGLRADDYFSPDEFAHVYEFNTPTTINALGIATSDIAEMGLREISRTVMQAQRDQFFANREKSRYDDHTEQHETGRERSKQYGDHLQDAGWLSGAEPADAADTGGASGQVRGAAESVPEEAPQSALHQPQDQRQADGASGRDRADRAEDGGADRGADGESRGRDGGTESDRSHALDGPDEQSPAQRGGTGAQRPDLRLTTEEPTEAGSDELPAFAAIGSDAEGGDLAETLPAIGEFYTLYDGAAVYDAETHQCLRVYGDYPDEKAQEQAAAFALEHDTVTPNGTELPAFLDMHLIEANLLDDGGRKHKRQEIFEYFQAHKNLAERTEFLKNSYNDIWVEVLTDGVRTGYHAEKDGLLMWEGSYLSRTSESVFSWSVITEMTEGLIERGEYKIKLGLQNAPIVAEQLALFDMGGNAPVYEAPADTATGILAPARTVPQEVIDLALCTGGNEPNSAERIAVFYMRERPEQKNEELLRREFGTENGRGIEYEGRKYAVWFLEDGIHLAQGDSVRTGYSKTMVTWEQASARILNLLEAGTYLSASELAQAPDKVLHEAMDALLMTARDLNEEGRGQGLFPQTLAIHDQHKGYPELDEDMVAFAKTEGGLQTLAQEYHAFLDAYATAPEIMRFRVSGYNTHRIGVVLDGLPYPERRFTAQSNFLRQCKMFITQDEIDQFFLRDSVDRRLAVYSHFCYPHTPEEHQKFIKGSFGEYSGGARAGYGYTKTYKGLDYERDYNSKKYDSVHLTVPNVVKEYQKLITQQRFPGEDAIAKIPEYECGQLARAIYSSLYDTPDNVPRPYYMGMDYYQAVPLIEEELQDKSTAMWLMDALNARLGEMQKDDRHYEFVHETHFQLYAYVNGEFSLFNHQHDGQLTPTAPNEPTAALVREAATPSEETMPTPPEPVMPMEPEVPEPLSIGTRLTIDGRQFEVDSVDDHTQNVSLRDVTFEGGTGFPIFRKESIDYVRAHMEQPDIARETTAPQTDEPPAALTSPKKEKQNALAYPLDADGRNYRITDDHIGEGAPLERFQRNLDAIRTLKTVEAESRAATAEEQAVLAQYVGWGGLADFFDEKNPRYAELKELLTDAEYAAARESTLTAFYTPPVVIRGIYAALGQMGFTQGNILEPACGIGNFLGMLPESMSGSKLYGVELDDLSGRIARQLYQKSSIAVQGYEKTAFPDNFFDVAIGNVPFGQFHVPDKRYDRLNFPIHEYFIAKALDQVRPGGVIAVVTSSYTMDKRTASARKYIAQRSELLGAIRLPNNAFKAAAGTEVVSDILFLQKRERMVDIEPEWVHLATNEDGIQMNSYFIDHPDMVLGEMKMVSGPFGPTPTCEPYPEQPLEALLAEAVQNVHGEITAYDREEELEGEDHSIEADPAVRNFSYTLVDGQIYYRENSRMNPVEVSKTAESRIRGMIELRDCVRTLLEYQTEDYPDEEIKAQQAKLNALYDAFTRKYGLINFRGNAIAFDQDSSYFLLCSLEILDEDRNLKRKADLFTKRTIRSHRPAEKVDTAVEALALSIGEKARVDMEYMSRLTGKDEENLFSDLKGVVFLNPNYKEGVNEKYLPADEYLSGNVRQKWAIAKAKAEQDPQYQINADALAQVQPTDLTASEISVRLGATWLDTAYVRQFIFETLGTPRSAQWSMKVHYSGITGEWRIEGKSKDRGNVKAISTYGTKRVNAYEIIETTLNLKDVRIFDYQYDEEGRRIAVLNKKETAIAQSKQELIKDAFAEWIWKDPDRREAICKTYNILFNSNRPREYDGSHISFSGMNPEITLRKHQVNAIAHILYGGNTLLAHVVGAGKTFEMVAAAMESKRLGLCQKSLFVVPNHLTEQWATEFLQLYPAANILVATRKDFETKNRKKFCGRIATGDYDAVIIGHSQFEKIPMSVERQRTILEQQIDEIMMGISEAKREKAENFTIKQMEKTKKGLQAKIDKLNDQSRKDDVVTFEELGVDRIFIDESHYFKNLFLYTKMRNVGGIAQTEAQKSSDLFMKCRYLDEITGGRGIVFATGTPISNSMVELYTIQRYAEIKALASGNPMIKEKMDLDIEVSKLKLLKANHLSQKYALEDAISKGFPKQIAETQARITGYGADIAAVKENTHPNGDGFSPLTLAGVTHADKKEAGAALLTLCQNMLSPEATQVGFYRGLTLELAFDTFAREYRLTMIGQLRHTVTLGTDVFGNLQRMDNALEGLSIKEQACREQLSNLQTQLETAKAEVQKPFPREAELNTKTARLEELNSLLNLDHKEPEIVDAEPDEDQRPPERRRPQLER